MGQGNLYILTPPYFVPMGGAMSFVSAEMNGGRGQAGTMARRSGSRTMLSYQGQSSLTSSLYYLSASKVLRQVIGYLSCPHVGYRMLR